MSRNFAEFHQGLGISSRTEIQMSAAAWAGESAPAADPMTILGHMLAAIADDRFEDLVQWLADDVEMDVHGYELLRGSWRGVADVARAIERNFGKLTEQRPAVRQMVASENVIAVLTEESGRIAATNERYSVRGMMWYEFADGKLKRFEEYLVNVPVMPEGAP